LSADAPTGPFRGKLSVSSAAFPNLVLEVPIEGLVSAGIVCVPPSAYFGIAHSRESAKRLIQIRSRTGAPFAIREATTTARGIRVEEPVRVGDAEWALSVTLLGTEEGTIDDRILVRTDMLGAELIDVPVYAQVVAH